MGRNRNAKKEVPTEEPRIDADPATDADPGDEATSEAELCQPATGRFRIVIDGEGTHHAAANGNAAEREADVDQMAQDFADKLRDAGHTVHLAHFQHPGGQVDVLARVRDVAGKVAVLLLACLAFALAGCKVSGGVTGGGSGLPVVAVVQAVDTSGVPLLFARSDGDTTVAMSATKGSAYIFDKASGVTVLGPVIFEAPHSVVVVSRKRSFHAQLAPGVPLPDWVQDTGLFRPGEAAALGLSFEAPPAPPAPPSPGA